MKLKKERDEIKNWEEKLDENIQYIKQISINITSAV